MRVRVNGFQLLNPRTGADAEVQEALHYIILAYGIAVRLQPLANLRSGILG